MNYYSMSVRVDPVLQIPISISYIRSTVILNVTSQLAPPSIPARARNVFIEGVQIRDAGLDCLEGLRHCLKLNKGFRLRGNLGT